MSALADQLVNWANSAQDLAWSRFQVVTKHAAKFGLTAADVDRWANPGEPAFVAHLVSDEANLFLRRAVAGHTLARIFHAAPLYDQICVDFGAG